MSRAKPEISVITCCYNREKYLSSTIKSVLRSTFDNFQYLIWDDGSTDQSLEIIKDIASRDSRIVVLNSPHQGLNKCLSNAHSLVEGKYTCWVDSDDLISPSCLSKTYATLESNSDYGVVYTDYIDIDNSGAVLNAPKRTDTPYSRDQLLRNFMTFHFRLFRSELWRLAGGISPKLEYALDYDFCLRLSEITNFYHLRERLYFYRQHNESVSILYQETQRKSAIAARKDAEVRRASRTLEPKL